MIFSIFAIFIIHVKPQVRPQVKPQVRCEAHIWGEVVPCEAPVGPAPGLRWLI